MGSKDIGIKVVKPGTNIDTTDIRDILMSSEFNMLKFHSEEAGSITMHPGDTDQYVDFAHSLGYVPAFIAFFKDGTKIYNINALVATNNGVYCRADASKIRCGWGFYTSSYGETTYGPTSPDLDVDYWDDYFDDVSFLHIGNKSGEGPLDGALRFDTVDIPQGATITYANLSFPFEFKGSGTNLRISTYGIAEDDTAGFTSNPMTRTKTSARTNNSLALTNTRCDIDVLSQVQEIVSRGGWVSGNAMGFLLFDNGSDSDAYVEDDRGSGLDCVLTITAVSGPNKVIDFRIIIFKDKLA